MFATKGQSVITVIFWVGIFVVLWALFLGKWLATWGRLAVTQNGLTGIEAFLYSNLNFVVFIALLLSMLAYAYFGANQ